MSIIQNQPLNFIELSDKNLQKEEKLPKQDRINDIPLFSYSVSTDKDKFQNVSQLIAHIKTTNKNLTFKKEKSKKDYLTNRIISSKDGFKTINYEERVKRDINEEINYKNSFVEEGFESIPNATPLFITLTLDSHLHCKFKDGRINPLLKGLKGKELEETFYKIHYEALNTLSKFNPTLIKNRTFRKDKLSKSNRASISATEPHEDLTPHEHQLHMIDRTYIKDFVRDVLNTVLKLKLGRTQIVVAKEDLQVLLKEYKTVKKLATRIKKGIRVPYYKYIIAGSPAWFEEFVIEDGNTIKSVSNYISSYVETKHILDDDSQSKKQKKSIIEYTAFAYYMASLKDKFEPLENHIPHKKIRRIRYTQLLISRTIYKRIMTNNFIEELKKSGEYDAHNMYQKVTTMIKRNELKIYKYHEVFARKEDNSPKYEKDNINYISFSYKAYDELVDCKSFDIYKKNFVTGELVLEHKSKQIDLGKDDFMIVEYKLKRNGNKYISEVF